MNVDDIFKKIEELNKCIEEGRFKDASDVWEDIIMYFKGIKDRTVSYREREILDIWITLFKLMQLHLVTLDRITEELKKVDYRIVSLDNRIRKLEKESNNVSNIVQILEDRVNRIEHRINSLSEALEGLGRMKQEDCAHFDNGFCTHQRFASPTPHEWAKRTTKIGEFFYPEVDPIICSLCPYFVEKEKEEQR